MRSLVGMMIARIMVVHFQKKKVEMVAVKPSGTSRSIFEWFDFSRQKLQTKISE
jgi:hypothetical protein